MPLREEKSQGRLESFQNLTTNEIIWLGKLGSDIFEKPTQYPLTLSSLRLFKGPYIGDTELAQPLEYNIPERGLVARLTCEPTADLTEGEKGSPKDYIPQLKLE